MAEIVLIKYTLRQVLENHCKFQQPTVANYLDFLAAFNAVNRESLGELIEADDIPVKLDYSKCLPYVRWQTMKNL